MWEWIFLLDYVVVFAVSKIVDWVLIDNIVSTILYFICKCIYPEAHPARPASGRGGGVVMTPPQQTMPTQYTGGQQPYSPPPQSWPQQGYAPPASGQPPQMVYYQPQGAPQQQHYMAPQGYAPPFQQAYAPPPQGYAPPPQGYVMPQQQGYVALRATHRATHPSVPQ